MLHWTIPDWCKEAVTMYWYTGCSYIDGHWSYGPVHVRNIEASVQNPASNLREQNLEGTQDIENRVLFTNEDFIQTIQAGGQDSVFFVTSDNKRWFMTGWERWNYLMPHYRITLIGESMLGFPDHNFPDGQLFLNDGDILQTWDLRILYRDFPGDPAKPYQFWYENTLRRGW